SQRVAFNDDVVDIDAPDNRAKSNVMILSRIDIHHSRRIPGQTRRSPFGQYTIASAAIDYGIVGPIAQWMPRLAVVGRPRAKRSRNVPQPDPDSHPGRPRAKSRGREAPRPQEVFGEPGSAQVTARWNIFVKVVIILVPLHEGALVKAIRVKADG